MVTLSWWYCFVPEKIEAFWRKVAHLPTSKSNYLHLCPHRLPFLLLKWKGSYLRLMPPSFMLQISSLCTFSIISFLFYISFPVSNSDDDRMWKGHTDQTLESSFSPGCVISQFLFLFKAPDSCLYLLSDLHPLSFSLSSLVYISQLRALLKFTSCLCFAKAKV